jgi:hypothetical protein
MIPPFQAAVIIQIVSGASIAPDAPVDRVLSDAALQALWQASRTGYPLMVAARKTAAKQSPAPVVSTGSSFRAGIQPRKSGLSA